MTDFTITSGTASYQRVRRPADFESQTPALTLNFEVAPEADPEKVTAKVLRMAHDAVEGVFHASASAQIGSTETAQQLHRRTASKKASGVSPPVGDVPADTSQQTAVASTGGSTDVGTNFSVVPTSGSGGKPESDADEIERLFGGSEPEPETEQKPEATIEDVKTALMKASAHLRSADGPGNTNAITKLLASFNVGGYGSLKPEQYGDFIEKCKGLLTLKKGE